VRSLPDGVSSGRRNSEGTPEVKVGKINVDEQQELASAFNVMSIPTLVVLKNGKVVNQTVGARPKEQIAAMLG
jgi:thioredoxin 1